MPETVSVPAPPESATAALPAVIDARRRAGGERQRARADREGERAAQRAERPEREGGGAANEVNVPLPVGWAMFSTTVPDPVSTVIGAPTRVAERVVDDLPAGAVSVIRSAR